MRVVAASLVAAAPLALWGCGGGDDTTASPGGGGGGGGGGGTVNRPDTYKPTTVQMAWNNHFGAFADFDVDQIMWDYDGTSEITVFNDQCMGTDPTTPTGFFADYEKPRGMTRYVGINEIRGFFDSLFKQIDNIANVNFIGPKDNPNVVGGTVENGNGTAVVRERGAASDPIANANVFLTWRTSNLDNPITYATDTFSHRQIDGNFWIDHQTIVVTEPNSGGDKCSSTARRAPPADSTPLMQGWTNHLDAFGARTTAPGGPNSDGRNYSMLEDYIATSIISVYDNRDNTYAEHMGIAAITTFFDTLFTQMRDAANDDPKTIGGEGLRVGLLEIDEKFNTVFLAWSSRSHPRATDTFVFNSDGKIIRQNIVVETTSQIAASVAMVV